MARKLASGPVSQKKDEKLGPKIFTGDTSLNTAQCEFDGPRELYGYEERGRTLRGRWRNSGKAVSEVCPIMGNFLETGQNSLSCACS